MNVNEYELKLILQLETDLDDERTYMTILYLVIIWVIFKKCRFSCPPMLKKYFDTKALIFRV